MKKFPVLEWHLACSFWLHPDHRESSGGPDCNLLVYQTETMKSLSDWLCKQFRWVSRVLRGFGGDFFTSPSGVLREFFSQKSFSEETIVWTSSLSLHLFERLFSVWSIKKRYLIRWIEPAVDEHIQLDAQRELLQAHREKPMDGSSEFVPSADDDSFVRFTMSARKSNTPNIMSDRIRDWRCWARHYQNCQALQLQNTPLTVFSLRKALKLGKNTINCQSAYSWLDVCHWIFRLSSPKNSKKFLKFYKFIKFIKFLVYLHPLRVDSLLTGLSGG